MHQLCLSFLWFWWALHTPAVWKQLTSVHLWNSSPPMLQQSHKRLKRQPQSSEGCHSAGKQLLGEMWADGGEIKQKMTKKEETEDKDSGKDWKGSKGNNLIDSWSLIKLDRDIMKLKKSKFNQIPQQTITTSCFKFHREVDDNKWAFPWWLKEACSLCSL